MDFARLDIPVIMPTGMKKVEYAEDFDNKITCITTIVTATVDGQETLATYFTTGDIPTVDDTLLAEGSVALVLARV